MLSCSYEVLAATAAKNHVILCHPMSVNLHHPRCLAYLLISRSGDRNAGRGYLGIKVELRHGLGNEYQGLGVTDLDVVVNVSDQRSTSTPYCHVSLGHGPYNMETLYVSAHNIYTLS
jgi:hypothetical protein